MVAKGSDMREVDTIGKSEEASIVFCYLFLFCRKIISFFVGLRKTLSVIIFDLSVFLNQIWTPSTNRTHALSPLLVPFCIKLQPFLASWIFQLIEPGILQ